MLTPIVCPSCGMPLSDKAAVFNRIRRERAVANIEKFGGDFECLPNAVRHTEQVQTDVIDVLEKLGIDNDCCRMHMVTTVLWEEVY